MKTFKSTLPIIIVIAFAIFLRFFHVFELPFTTDEFSIIFRLNYANIHDLLEYGVKELDSHPAGLQLFYFLYTRIFGINEVVFKLPNLILGVLAVYLIYVLGKRWYNSTAGLFAASLMAFMQYAVVQSQTGRMYGFGVAFILLAVLFWDRIIKNTRVNFYDIAGFIVFASISCVTHYFSLLFIVILGLTGVFVVNKSNRIYYIISGVIIFLLFIPSLQIFLFQLSKGGIEGWMGSFNWSFFSHYFLYIFHFSWIIFIAVLLVLGFSFKLKLSGTQLKYRFISALWFLLPLIIGTIYSVFLHNVMHFKVLYFSFPFLLLFMASFIKGKSVKFELIMVVLLLMIGSWSLIYERMHYQLFCNDSTVFIYKNSVSWTQNIPADSVDIVKNVNIRRDAYYYKKNNREKPNIIYLDSLTIREFHELLQKSTKPYLFFGASTGVDAYLADALNYYPQVLRKEYTIAAETYLLKKGKAEDCDIYDNRSFNYDLNDYLKRTNNNKVSDSIITNEFLASVEFNLDTMVFSDKNIIDLSVEGILRDTIGGARLVLWIFDKEESVFWQGDFVDKFLIKDKLEKAIVPIPLLGLKLKKGLKAKVYIWNPKQSKYQFKVLNIRVRSGNPFIYASDNKITRPLSLFCIE